MMISIPLSSPVTISLSPVPRATLSKAMALLTGTVKALTVDRTSQLSTPSTFRFITNQDAQARPLHRRQEDLQLQDHQPEHHELARSLL